MADPDKYPTRIPPYGLRMPPELKERLQNAADLANRSLHAEIILRLERSFGPLGELPDLSSENMEVLGALHELMGQLESINKRIDKVELTSSKRKEDSD